jgi:hypothetical protein
MREGGEGKRRRARLCLWAESADVWGVVTAYTCCRQHAGATLVAQPVPPLLNPHHINTKQPSQCATHCWTIALAGVTLMLQQPPGMHVWLSRPQPDCMRQKQTRPNKVIPADAAPTQGPTPPHTIKHITCRGGSTGLPPATHSCWHYSRQPCGCLLCKVSRPHHPHQHIGGCMSHRGGCSNLHGCQDQG